MRLPQMSADAAILSAVLFPLLVAAVGNIGCEHVVVEGHSWDLSKLGGPKSAMHSEDLGNSFRNTTYTIDICQALRRSPDVKAEEQCPSNTRVCAIEREIQKGGGADIIGQVIPIAGELKEKGGYNMDAKWLRLKTADSKADAENEGLRLTMNGGWITKDKRKRKQKAVVEFLCDKDLVGDENLWKPEDIYEKRAESDDDKKDDEDKEPVEDPATAPSLTYEGYDSSGEDFDVLRMKWRTKYACEGSKEEQDAERGEHWGFFTWFIIIAFLSTATYLIFGSWLNYNRYGARGWDLLPHGDTIRDVPYLMKDWSRRVLVTVQGGGSRGGYAAV